MVSLLEIMTYAFIDAINPCALAVMAIVLMSLLLQDPTKRKKVILGGFAFALAVFILYFIYGILMIFLFQKTLPNLGIISNYVFKGFGLFAIILGILNIKDYLKYQPGNLMTEMPMSMRPGMKSLVRKIKTPIGAFVIGLFVTFFLLPCTIGPYVIASARLAKLSLATILSWLLVYNLIFILPMIAITLIIYFSLTTVESISGWRERNIRRLHLIEGAILIILGILMVTGLI